MALIRFVLGLFALIVISCSGAYWFMLGLPGQSHLGALPPLVASEKEMAQTLRNTVADIAAKPHNTDHPAGLEAVARRIEAALGSFGYVPRALPYQSAGMTVRNIEVVIEPKSAPSKEAAEIANLVIGAHYDSFGDSPGANDNGSGVAALLILARELKSHTMTSTRLRLVFFVNEEPPHYKTEHMGSIVYAKALIATGQPIRGMLSLETLGSFSEVPGSQQYPQPFAVLLPNTGNFVAIVGTLSARSLASDVTRLFRETTAFPSVGGVAPGSIEGITWSDHWSFGQFNIPAVMITDTAVFRYPHYHRATDTWDKLDYERLARVTAGLVRVVRGLAQ
jgi:hypothetical protein